MNVSVIVSTFGSEEWERLGRRAAEAARFQEAVEVVIVHTPDGTLADARNAGAAQAVGEWLCFLDADDQLAPGYLAAMKEALPGEGRWLLTPAVEYVVRRRSRARPKIWPKVDLRDGNWLVIGTLVQAEVFHEVGGFKDWPLYEDWCLWQRCWQAGAEPVEVPEAIYIAQTRPRSRNRQPSRVEKLRVHREIVAANFPGHLG